MKDSHKHKVAGGISSIKRELLASLLAEDGFEPSRKIPKRETSGAAPLSFAQQRLWFLDQLTPNTPLYNISREVRLNGRLDLDVLDRVFGEILRRHEILRTRIEVEAGSPAQVIEEWKHWRLEVQDLTGLNEQERAEEAKRIAREEARTGFDLRQGPLLRMKVLRLAEEVYELIFTMHHIVSDGWSMGILTREVGTLYQAYSMGALSPLEELPIQYADFAVWQRAYLAGEVLEVEVEYWKEQLKDAAAMKLPVDHTRPAAMSYRGGIERVEIGKEVREGLKRLSQREGATMFMALMAAFKALLMRYSGAEDISVGTPIANRTRREVEGLIGFFVNTLVLRTDLGGNPRFRELLEREREVALGAYGRQEVPFEKLVEEINPERYLGRSPLFQVMMALQNIEQEELELRGLKVTGIGEETEVAKFDLTLMLTERAEGIVGVMEYSRDLYEGETIRRMARHYEKVLEEVVRDAKQRIKEIRLLTETETRQIIEEWNETGKECGETQLAHEMIGEQARLRREAIAVKSEQGELSYGELDLRSNQLGNYLRKKGVGREDLVGICADRSAEMVIAMLGILKAGAAYVPIDGSYPEDRVRSVLEDAKVKVLLTQGEAGRRLNDWMLAAEVISLEGCSEEIAEEREDSTGVKVEGDNLAYVIYTSGSTGKPNGVLVRHQALANSTRARFHYYREPVFTLVSTLPFGFDGSVAGLYWTLCGGGKLALPSEKLVRDSAQLARSMAEINISHLLTIPTLYSSLLMEPELVQIDSLKSVILGGEAWPSEMAKRHFAALAGVELFNEYGPTEGTVWSSVYGNCSKLSGDPPPIGKPITNVQMYILDEELEPAPIRVRGEIYITGAGLARGYLGKSELTAERFIPHRFGKIGGERIYRTGDVGRYLLNGEIEFTGRTDAQVKVRGYRLEPGEIEAVLDQHESVKQSVVLAKKNERGNQRLVAYVVGEGEATSTELKKYVRERLPEYMVPEAVILLEKMPVTVNGKIDRERLSLLKDAVRQPEQEYVAPQTLIEEIVVGIFEEVLKLDRIGRSENFFEIGGHSLLATQAISRVKNTFGVEIGVKSIFEKPAVEGLASKIEEAMRSGEKDEAPPLIRVSKESQRSGQSGVRLPLSFAQQRLWFLDQLAPNNPFYNIHGAVRLEGKLDLEALERVISEIVRRHEVLRTRFEVVEGEPVQVIDEWEPWRLEVENLTDLIGEAREEEASRLVSEEALTEFDLSRGPLLRVKSIELEEGKHVLLFTMHHIVSDGWSLGILIREMGALYKAYSAGEESPLKELPIQYADFSVWQREWLKGEVLEEKLDYWRKQLAGLEALELPADYPRPAARSYRGASRSFVMDRELAEKLRALGQREGVTLFMTLLGGFYVLMSRYSGRQDVALGTDIANRNRSEIEGLIGFFVNQLVLRVEAPASERFVELLKRVREVCLGAYAHQDAPFEKLVEELQPERDLSRSPLFQAKLIWQNAPREELELGELRLSRNDETRQTTDQTQTAKFDLTVSVVDAGRDLVVAVNYSRDLFEEETIERLTSHYTNMLRAIVEESERPVSELSLLSGQEREQIVVEWNETVEMCPDDRCIHELFEQQAEIRPETIALIYENQQLTYAELNARANQLGRRLRRLSVGPETLVGICVERSLEAVVGLLAILKAGGAYIPLDPAYPVEHLTYMLEDSAPAVILTHAPAQAQIRLALAGVSQTLPVIDLEIDVGNWAIQPHSNPDRTKTGLTPEHTAYVIYTSGSTGRPKGVMVEHAELTRLFSTTADWFHFDQNDVWTLFHSLAFDFSVWEIWGALIYGGRLVVAPRLTTRSPEEFHQLLCGEMVTILNQTPSAFRQLMAAQVSSRQAHQLRQVIFGGEALEVATLKSWRQDRRNQRTRLINMYGITETTVHVTYRRLEPPDSERPGTSPIGRRIPDLRVYLLDNHGQPVPIGLSAEMYVGGAGVARGYLNRPELTAERFVADPLAGHPGARMYKTGDLARFLPNGEMEFLGRNDFQVKVRGFRIELGEIEARLLRYPAIREAVVVARESDQGDKRLVAYYTAPPAADMQTTVSAEVLRAHLSAALPEHMVPSAYVMLEALPLTANGKLDRRALPSPGGEAYATREYEAPVGEIETALARIWAELLQLERVGRHDHFFELGGHSLLAVRLIERMRAEGLHTDVRALFATPTLNEFAAATEDMEVSL